jgi:hypothetical protein
VGVDGDSHDVKFFGATSGTYLLWDEDQDELTFVAADLDMDDASVIRLGTGDDLQIFANGSHSFIDHDGDGDLWVRALGSGDELYLEADDNIVLRTGATPANRVTVDTAGLVGIGRVPTDSMKLDIETSNAATYCRIKITEAYSSYSPAALWIEGGANAAAGIYLGDAADPDIGSIIYENGDNSLRFKTNTAERMRITSAGNVQLGYAGDYGSLNPLMLLYPSSGHGPTLFINCYDSADTAVKFYSRVSAAPHDAGQITVDGASVTYASNSDYRLKENVVDLTGAMDRVKQLRPVNFTWIAEPACGVREGFIAHEVAEVVPQAVVGDKDAVLPAVEGVEAVEAVEATYDEDGALLTAAIPAVEAVDAWPERPDPQSLDTSHLVPLLTAAVQELEARIAALEAA